MSRLLLLLIALALLAAAVSFALPATTEAAQLRTWGLGLAELGGLLLVLYNGTLVRTGYFYALLAGWTLALVGGLFKIQHWAGADVLLLLGLGGAALLYAVWFARKPVKTGLDLLKLLWVLAATLVPLGVLLRWLPRPVAVVPHLLLGLLVLAFVATDYRRRADTAGTQLPGR